MIALFDFTGPGNTGLYIWTGILIAVIMAIAIPLTIYEQKIVKSRWKTVSEFIEKNANDIKLRPFDRKATKGILLPVFSGFLIHGHFTYICLDPDQDRQPALRFIEELKTVCLQNNSWHFDFFTNHLYLWWYYGKAMRAFR